MIKIDSRIVRECCVFSEDDAIRWGDKKVEDFIAETDKLAFHIADYYGIKNRDISRMFALDTVCDFTDYPMYLLGPNAPQIKTWKDVFKHDYRDNPRCRYTIVIRDRDEEKSYVIK
jgi:hypothetical protein